MRSAFFPDIDNPSDLSISFNSATVILSNSISSEATNVAEVRHSSNIVGANKRPNVQIANGLITLKILGVD